MRAAIVFGLSSLLLSACGLATNSGSSGKEGEEPLPAELQEVFEGPVARAN